MRRNQGTAPSVSVIASDRGERGNPVLQSQHTTPPVPRDWIATGMKPLAMTILVVGFLSFPAAASDAQSSGAEGVKKNGGLACFSVEPPAPEPNLKREDYPTCDELCAKQDAACTGMQNSGLNPPVTCEDHTSNTLSVCRCCKVGQ